MKNVNTRLVKDKYKQLSELGSRYNLSFSSHLILGSKLIALDGINKSLLISEVNNELDQPHIIELNKVAAVSIKKGYGNIKPGQLTNKSFEEFLKRIDLKFEYGNQDQATVFLTFYDSETDEVRDIPRLERNAKNWQLILSKMLVSRTEKIMKRQTEASLA